LPGGKTGKTKEEKMPKFEEPYRSHWDDKARKQEERKKLTGKHKKPEKMVKKGPTVKERQKNRKPQGATGCNRAGGRPTQKKKGEREEERERPSEEKGGFEISEFM